MRNLAILVFCVVTVSACWAPRCPVDGCQFVREHRHSDLVSGTFRSRYMVPPRVHHFWDGTNKGEKLGEPNLAPKGANKKARKKFPWEKW